MASLKDLFVSKVRVKLLKTFLSNPDQIYYVRQLVRRTEEEINAVRRELKRMEQRGMVRKEPRGNRLYYGFRKDYLFYQNLLELITKTTGLGAALIKNKNKIGKIKYAMLSGKFIRKKPIEQSEVSLLVIGDVVLAQMAALIKDYETKLKRDIHYTVMTKEEFEFRKKRRDPFITTILMHSRVMLVGDEEEMLG
jgi:uncharacterized protein